MGSEMCIRDRSKGNGKRRVEVVAAEMLVVMFLVEFQVFRV